MTIVQNDSTGGLAPAAQLKHSISLSSPYDSLSLASFIRPAWFLSSLSVYLPLLRVAFQLP